MARLVYPLLHPKAVANVSTALHRPQQVPRHRLNRPFWLIPALARSHLLCTHHSSSLTSASTNPRSGVRRSVPREQAVRRTFRFPQINLWRARRTNICKCPRREAHQVQGKSTRDGDAGTTSEQGCRRTNAAPTEIVSTPYPLPLHTTHRYFFTASTSPKDPLHSSKSRPFTTPKRS